MKPLLAVCFLLSIPTPAASAQCIYHDGSSETAVGFGALNGTDVLWMQRCGGVGQSTVVSSISTAWGTPTFPGSGPANGSAARLGIWQDTDNDGDPTTGLVLVAGPINVVVSNTDTDALDTYSLAQPLAICGVFFIGASSEGSFPAPLDTHVAGLGRSWVVGNDSGAATINYANLNAEPLPPTDEDSIAPGVWLIQADGGSPNQCNNSVTHSGQAQRSTKRVKMRVIFTQVSSTGCDDNYSACVIDFKVQKRVLFFWVNTSAQSILVSGSFVASRSPSGYVLPNPFSSVSYTATSGGLLHFVDYSSPALPCYSMTHGNYFATVVVGGVTLNPFVSW